jgi:hypothetical protein
MNQLKLVLFSTIVLIASLTTFSVELSAECDLEAAFQYELKNFGGCKTEVGPTGQQTYNCYACSLGVERACIYLGTRATPRQTRELYERCNN